MSIKKTPLLIVCMLFLFMQFAIVQIPIKENNENISSLIEIDKNIEEDSTRGFQSNPFAADQIDYTSYDVYGNGMSDNVEYSYDSSSVTNNPFVDSNTVRLNYAGNPLDVTFDYSKIRDDDSVVDVFQSYSFNELSSTSFSATYTHSYSTNHEEGGTYGSPANIKDAVDTKEGVDGTSGGKGVYGKINTNGPATLYQEIQGFTNPALSSPYHIEHLYIDWSIWTDSSVGACHLTTLDLTVYLNTGESATIRIVNDLTTISTRVWEDGSTDFVSDLGSYIDSGSYISTVRFTYYEPDDGTADADYLNIDKVNVRYQYYDSFENDIIYKMKILNSVADETKISQLSFDIDLQDSYANTYVYIYNYDTDQWFLIGQGLNQWSGFQVSYTLSSNIPAYIDDSLHIVAVRLYTPANYNSLYSVASHVTSTDYIRVDWIANQSQTIDYHYFFNWADDLPHYEVKLVPNLLLYTIEPTTAIVSKDNLYSLESIFSPTGIDITSNEKDISEDHITLLDITINWDYTTQIQLVFTSPNMISNMMDSYFTPYSTLIHDYSGDFYLGENETLISEITIADYINSSSDQLTHTFEGGSLVYLNTTNSIDIGSFNETVELISSIGEGAGFDRFKYLSDGSTPTLVGFAQHDLKVSRKPSFNKTSSDTYGELNYTQGIEGSLFEYEQNITNPTSMTYDIFSTLIDYKDPWVNETVSLSSASGTINLTEASFSVQTLSFSSPLNYDFTFTNFGTTQSSLNIIGVKLIPLTADGDPSYYLDLSNENISYDLNAGETWHLYGSIDLNYTNGNIPIRNGIFYPYVQFKAIGETQKNTLITDYPIICLPIETHQYKIVNTSFIHQYSSTSINTFSYSVNTTDTCAGVLSLIMTDNFIDTQEPAINLIFVAPDIPVINSIDNFTDFSQSYRLTWTNVNAQNYTVYLSDQEVFSEGTIKTFNTSNTYYDFNISDLVWGYNYFWIQAHGENRSSYRSNTFKLTLNPFQIPPTISLTNSSNIYPGDSLSLTWTADSNAIEYLLYRSPTISFNITTMQPIAVTTSTSYSDVAPDSGIYYYAVLCRGYGLRGNLSIPLSLNVLAFPKAPVLTSQIFNHSIVVLSWDSIEGGVKYEVYRSDQSFIDKDDANLIATVQTTEYSDNSERPAGYYYYMVVVYNSDGRYTQSNIVSEQLIIWTGNSNTQVIDSSLIYYIIGGVGSIVVVYGGYRIYRKKKYYY